jgi:hypothetical protein
VSRLSQLWIISGIVRLNSYSASQITELFEASIEDSDGTYSNNAFNICQPKEMQRVISQNRQDMG